LSHLAWLDLASEPGQAYWAAMELLGRYVAANHAVIHKHVVRALGVHVLLDVENHHNFAWRERHVLPDGSEDDLIVHRKGATPAGEGVLGIIPGSMAGLRGPRQGCSGLVELGSTRRGPPYES
jgi:tRNA-splicing ligase RtcB